MSEMKKKISYQLSGIVLGKMWGSGYGGYTARNLSGSNLKQILSKASKNLDAQDSGMGFEEVVGVIYSVIKTTKIIIKEKTYSNEESLPTEIIGNMNNKEMDMLIQMYNNY